ncbi:Mannan endo-1,4-beta-mannosidase 1 [Acorus calamus]|uniref:mannan endo-1,4-beta-mannosidase n=1 Tax=Acorus calamus TaxID=4465 RepID=A0AAV9F2L9_ACOCL|nr:Mannan endo-1,4-beta-mannosidase 1 [Acorus calamus]
MIGKKGFFFYVMVCLALMVLKHGVVVSGQEFVRVSGNRFMLNGRSFYSNGFNAYWMMDMAADPNERDRVTEAFQQASSQGMYVVRTWAFADGGDEPLQISPGNYNENMFRALDFVVSEAKRFGVYVILSLVNNYDAYGGRKQYVQWARDQGQYLNGDDDFYRNELVRGFYKNHVRAVLTRVNTITGVAYKDEPAIFAWELMNEPRCQSDLSGNTLQDWISVMASHVKSIDSNHMLEVGLEGFYGESMQDRKQYNPGYEVGSDYITNNQVQGIDFATIHAYPDQWMSGSDEQSQLNFLQRWLESHIQDAGSVIGKPLFVTEFGRSSRLSGYNTGQRDTLYSSVYNTIYGCARSGGPCSGALFWQLLEEGMDNWDDGYEVVMSEQPSTANIIAQQSRQISSLNGASSLYARVQEMKRTMPNKPKLMN